MLVFHVLQADSFSIFFFYFFLPFAAVQPCHFYCFFFLTVSFSFFFFSCVLGNRLFDDDEDHGMNAEVSMMSGFSVESSFVGRRLDMLDDDDEVIDDKKEMQKINKDAREEDMDNADTRSLHLEDMEASIMSRVSFVLFKVGEDALVSVIQFFSFSFSFPNVFCLFFFFLFFLPPNRYGYSFFPNSTPSCS